VRLPWPGNVRELKNVLTEAAMDSRGEVLLAEVVKSCLAYPQETTGALRRPRTLEEVEKEHIIKALERTSWNQSAAARALGISRPTLRKRLKAYGLQN
jgi:two-component system response regulator AtoC